MCYLTNRELSGADDEQTFLNFQCYPDKATIDFIIIVVKHLGKKDGIHNIVHLIDAMVICTK